MSNAPPKRPSARSLALTAAKVAGYHQDARAFTRLRVESRVSIEALAEQWRLGVRAKEAGARCDCLDCNQTKEKT